jgi:acyl-CoA synthetase (NDP forming)
MPIRSLDRIFRPQHVAVIGGSPQTGSVGRTVLQNLAKGGFPSDLSQLLRILLPHH